MSHEGRDFNSKLPGDLDWHQRERQRGAGGRNRTDVIEFTGNPTDTRCLRLDQRRGFLLCVTVSRPVSPLQYCEVKYMYLIMIHERVEWKRSMV